MENGGCCNGDEESSIRNIEITGCLFDINLNAIALLMDKVAAALFE